MNYVAIDLLMNNMIIICQILCSQGHENDDRNVRSQGAAELKINQLSAHFFFCLQEMKQLL